MEAKVGITVYFEYDEMEYERDIESIKVYKNYSWIGDLGFGGNLMFLIHGNLKNGKPKMDGLSIQVDSFDDSIHEYVRNGITFK